MVGQTRTYELDYTPPLDWAFFLQYLGARATLGVEAVEEERYVRTFALGESRGTLSFTHHPTAALILLTIEAKVGTETQAILARARRMFDLEIDLSSVHLVLGADPRIGPLLAASPGIRVPGAWSPFELLVRTIVGQQVTVKAATTIMGRIASRLGEPVDPASRGGPSFLFPTPRAVADGKLEAIGMPSRRVQTLQHVARAIADATIPFPDGDSCVVGVKEALLSMPGIGPWTVEYFALRALREADAWPGTDLVLRRALEPHEPGRPTTAADHWRPFRGYAAVHLWNHAARQSLPQTADQKKNES
ncbi:DNA-3-methyladenine glycosylase II [Singulisphaera sp. GP187]|uniref:DNA-3-methyladenine glycosylase family protein n=1 Tax=Singulisphaera sp. GP187 TaxID=1882752 RepID=UPI000927E84A|nr:AlkA N-terminal domain-containing protein [Singulisphaera sp. GP187]SIO60840.1 DNA-3-methyladenine glycosylase II [Singulisphaera sp. GP187]